MADQLNPNVTGGSGAPTPGENVTGTPIPSTVPIGPGETGASPGPSDVEGTWVREPAPGMDPPTTQSPNPGASQ